MQCHRDDYTNVVTQSFRLLFRVVVFIVVSAIAAITLIVIYRKHLTWGDVIRAIESRFKALFSSR